MYPESGSAKDSSHSKALKPSMIPVPCSDPSSTEKPDLFSLTTGSSNQEYGPCLKSSVPKRSSHDWFESLMGNIPGTWSPSVPPRMKYALPMFDGAIISIVMLPGASKMRVVPLVKSSVPSTLKRYGM